MQRVTTTHGLFITAIAVALVAGVPRVAGAQDAKHGEQVYAAQKCSVCHSVAGKGGKSSPLDGVGAKLSADDIRAVDRRAGGDDDEDGLDQEAADAEAVRQAAGG